MSRSDRESATATARLWITLATLIFAAVAAASVCRLPSTRYISWGQFWTAALVCVLAVFCASLLAAWALSALIPQLTRLDSRRVILGTSLNALWLIPLTLFIRENSPWTLAVASVFAVLVTCSIRQFQPPITTSSTEESLLRSLHPDPLPLSFKRAPQYSVAAALCAQVGVIAAFGGYPFAAAVLVGIAFSAWSSSYTRNQGVQARLHSPASESRDLALASVAFLLVLAALFPYLQSARGHGRFGISPGVHRYVSVHSGDRSGQPVRVTHVDESVVSSSEGETGIILWPVNPVVTALVAPTPAQFTQRATGRAANPLVIPFNGVYWFFKAPDAQPPKTSRQAHVSPETVEIRSTDRRPLSIEAHDYLGSLIDLNCCSRIEIAIRNADRYPETVSLELVLVNTSLPSHPSESLGRSMVKSTRPWSLFEKKPPLASEMLNFAIPQRSSLHRFDEVKIVFRLDRARADAGAKIAIDHFVLVPRGL